MSEGIALLLIAGVLGAAVFLAVLNCADFTIRLGGGRVRIKGRIASARKGEITDFFEREFTGQENVTIRGWRQGRDRLRLRFSGKVPAGDQQQIRNFLVLVLCR